MGKAKRPQKPNATGRNSETRFARLDHAMLHSNAYRALTPNARSLLVELTSMENDKNNGSLFLSVQDAAHRMGVADLTAASAALDQLQELGFIEMTHDAHFAVKAAETSRARCWRLTWRPGPGRRGPSCEYQTREPAPGTPARKRMERGLRALKAYKKAKAEGKLPVLDSNTTPTKSNTLQPAPVLDSSTAIAESDGFPPKSVVLDSAIHTAGTMGTRDGGGKTEPERPSKSRAAHFAAGEA